MYLYVDDIFVCISITYIHTSMHMSTYIYLYINSYINNTIKRLDCKIYAYTYLYM